MKKIIFLLCLCISFVFAKQIYIVHGYDSDENYGFLPSVAKNLKAKNHEVLLLSFPNAFSPKLDENTFFITHSLGGVAVLDFLNSLDERTKIGGVIMVAPFDEPLAKLPILNDFIKPKLDYKKLDNMIIHKIIISAKDDKVVPTWMSENLAKKLNAKFIRTPNGGHFMESEGFKDLPLVIEELERIK
ncbi:serine hydrolase family protein [Campylobacter coli]|nr:serine hydrolase family protein [Campylobacter coli]